MTSGKSKLIYDVSEKAPLWLALLMAVQHVMLVYSEIIIFPVIVGKNAGAPMEHILFASFAAALAAGLATMLQVLRIGNIGTGYVLFMGSSAAYFTGCVDAVSAGGFALLATLSILVAPIEIFMSYTLRHLRHVFTPVVGGVILLLVVLSLVSVAHHEWMGEAGKPYYASAKHLVTGAVTMGTLLGLAMFGNRTLRLWCPIIGMAAGLSVSWSLGILDVSQAAQYPWFGRFAGSWPGIALSLKPEHFPLFLTLALLTVINGVQAIGNSMAIQRVSHREPTQVNYGVIQGTMYADGLSNIISGALGTMPNETYSENISVVRITGVASRMVGLLGAAILVTMPFMPRLSVVMVSLPAPVYGGFIMGLAAMMFPAGLELVFSNGITRQSGLMVGVSLCLGILAESGKFFPGVIPSSMELFLNNGVAAGGLVAVSLSLLFRLAIRSGKSFSIPASGDQFPSLLEYLQQAGEDLDLDQQQQYRLELVCEELFAHIAKNSPDASSVKIKVLKHDDELAVEIIHGEKVESIEFNDPADNLMKATPEEMESLGLMLVKGFVRNLHHVEISGTTYIWFKLD